MSNAQSSNVQIVEQRLGETTDQKLWRLFRVALLFIIHSAAFSAVLYLAFFLRFDFDIPPRMLERFKESLPTLVGIKLLVFYFLGSFFGWWRFITFSDLVAIARAALVSALILVAIEYFTDRSFGVPRSIIAIDFVLTVCAIGGLRSCVRFSREHFMAPLKRDSTKRALLVGANGNSTTWMRHFENDRTLQFRIVGFIDSDAGKRGLQIGGVKVLGSINDIQEIAKDAKARYVLVPEGSLTPDLLRFLMTECQIADLTVKVIPQLSDVMEGAQLRKMRDIDINDLLRRPPVELDTAAIDSLVSGKKVLVTGAGGSIGSEICRQVMKFAPESLILVEQAENNLFQIERELLSNGPLCNIEPCVADILDVQRMNAIFRDHRPHVVFHAAAHKHVPMMECNVGEAIKNNIFGTQVVADLSSKYCVSRFVFISTDKAVNPTSVMGATKHLAERYVLSRDDNQPTKFVVVRFGNVLGSNGSVVPIFQEQIRKGGPVTITDKRMNRFFMSIPEASQLVLQAAAFSQGGEIYVLDMGEPVMIIDLVHDLVRLMGLPQDSIEIKVTGLRPGEKLYEELYFDEETAVETHHKKIFAANPRAFDALDVANTIAGLKQAIQSEKPKLDLLQLMHEAIPELQHHLLANQNPLPVGDLRP
ncbi:MAG: nucleoside-diphosphate sugar epimerase/dehydratase [Pirellulaceae bacterium]|nr:nucleoside-diphosphate sugar epimerase/dehydratase [Pirellulaceae bacterium]